MDEISVIAILSLMFIHFQFSEIFGFIDYNDD